MEDRDRLREIARRTQEDTDWNNFKSARNNCTKEQRKDKSRFTRGTFEKIEVENDTGKLFGMTRNLLGWNKSTPPTMFI